MAENHHTQAPTGPRQEAPPSAPAVRREDPGDGKRPKKAPSPWLEVPGWIRERPWPVLLFVGLFVLAFMAWTSDTCVADCEQTRLPDYALPIATLVWIALLFAWFIDCFTGEAFEKRTRAIEFAYFFMVLSFCLVAIMIADMGKARKFGVVEGCVENLSRGNIMPIQCDYPKDIWSELKRAAGATATDASARAAPSAPDARDGVSAAESAAAEQLKFETRKSNYVHNHNYHYVLNIGGRLDRLEPAGAADCATCTHAVYAVRGGLPVPVYFIVLALIGGAISLAKNVPGIQKRSDSGWQGTPAEPRLTPGEVRELLLFQVLQFVTAPMLAVIAYHTIKPESSGSTVALGFIVGFGSDQILQLIRTMVKAPQGTAAASPVSMSIHGKVVRDTRPVSGAKVTIEGLANEARTDVKGEFVLTGLAVRPEAYVVRIVAADLTQVRRVRADEPKTVDLGAIDMAQPAPAANAGP